MIGDAAKDDPHFGNSEIALLKIVEEGITPDYEELSTVEKELIAAASEKVRKQLGKIRAREKQAERARSRDEFGQQALTRLEQEHGRAVSASRHSTVQRLAREVGVIADRLKACEAWLYIPRMEDGELVLRADVTHRTNQRGHKLTLHSKGIIARVAARKEAYLAAHLDGDPYYVSCIAKTISELAVPILDPQGELLGVLNLESSVGHFSEEDQIALQVTAQRLAVGLLCLRANVNDPHTPWPWSPNKGHWSGRSVPEQVSWAMSACLAGSAQMDSCNGIIWRIDRIKRQLWVLGTTSYDAYFQADGCLDLDDSYTGVVAELPPCSVRSTSPEKAPRYQEVARGRASGLKRMLSAPLYRLSRFGPSSRSHKAWAVAHAYYFGDAVSQALPSRAAFHDIATVIETWLSGYENLRRDCALAYLASKMDSSQLEWHGKNWRMSGQEMTWSILVGLQLNLLKDILEAVFDADGCTVFVPNQERNRLVMATSTGVGLNDDFDAHFLVKSADNRNPVWYELGSPTEESYGVLSYLYDHPEVPSVRINSLLAFEQNQELVTPQDLPRRVVRRYMEPLCEDTEDRRFLAGTMSEDGKTTAVIRIVRSIRKPPFTEDDAYLLEQLLRLCQEKRLWCGTPPISNVLAEKADAAGLRGIH